MSAFLVLANIISYIFLIIRPLYVAVKGLISFFTKYSIRSKSTSPDTILDCVEGNKDVSAYSSTISFPELLYNGIAPILGVFFVYYFHKEIKPFDLGHYPTLLAFSFIPFIAYWVMRKMGDGLSVKSLAVIEPSLIFGVVLYLIYGLHFCSQMTLLGLMIFPFLAFALIAPIPAMGFLLRELSVVRSLINQKTDHTLSAPSALKPAFRLREQTKGYAIFGVGFALLLISLVLLGGQDWDSLIKVFRGGQEFLFSIK